jgi:hypothetical protein
MTAGDSRQYSINQYFLFLKLFELLLFERVFCFLLSMSIVLETLIITCSTFHWMLTASRKFPPNVHITSGLLRCFMVTYGLLKAIHI